MFKQKYLLIFNVLLLASFSSFAFADVTDKALPGKRNILLLVADDLGVDLLQQYSSLTGNAPESLPATPTLDKLRNSGVIFDNAWSNPDGSPTRAGLLTGKHSFRTNVTANVRAGSDGLSVKEVTLPQLISRAGYVSGLFGQWHLGGDARRPLQQGFATHRGTLAGSLEQAPSTGYASWRKYNDGLIVDGYLKTPRSRELVTTYATKANVEDAAGWISRQKKFARKWMAVVAFNAPHSPLHTPNANCDGVENINPNINAMIECMDKHIGWLLQQLADSGELEKTTIIFIADNGTARASVQKPFSHSPNTSYKSFVYEGGIRIPYIIADGYFYKNNKTAPQDSGLGYITNPGRRDDTLVHTLDVFATVAQIAGVRKPVTFDSFSLLPILNADNQDVATFPRSQIYTDHCSAGLFQAAIRDKQYKLIYKVNYAEKSTKAEVSLYKASDLAETKNIYASQDDTNISRQLLTKLDHLWLSQTGRFDPLLGCAGKKKDELHVTF